MKDPIVGENLRKSEEKKIQQGRKKNDVKGKRNADFTSNSSAAGDLEKL